MPDNHIKLCGTHFVTVYSLEASSKTPNGRLQSLANVANYDFEVS